MNGPLLRRTVLASGVEVISERLVGLSSVTVGVWLGVGSRDEVAGQFGFAHLLEHTVFKGAGRFSAFELVDRVERWGGTLNAFTTQEETCLWGRVPDGALSALVEVLAAMVKDPHHRPEAVAEELPVVAAELAHARDDAEQRVHALVLERAFAPHPLSRPILGPADALAQLDPAELDLFHRHHWRPGTTVVTAAGAVDHDELVALVDTLLGDLGRPGGVRPPRDVPVFHPGGPVTVAGGGGLAHVTVTVEGRPAGASGALAVAACDVLVGTGMASRLFQGLREERQLAYTTYSRLSTFVDTGLFTLYAAVRPDRAVEAADALTETLRSLRSVSADEVARAVNLLRSARLLAGESGPARMQYLGLRAMSGLTVHSTGDDLVRYDRLGVDLVRAAAQQLAGAPTLTVTVLA